MKRAITNSRLVDVQTGDIQDNVTVYWVDGVIKAVGQHLELPTDVEVIDGKGYFVTPGLINAFNHLGLKETGISWQGNDSHEASGPIQPELLALDGINPFDAAFEQSRAAGVTTVHVAPGAENVISGVTAIVKTSGSTIEEMTIQGQHGLAVSLGEIPKETYSKKNKKPITRMGIASIIREELRAALAKSNHNSATIYDKILQKKANMYIQAHRADDIVTAIRLKIEFDINVVVVNATEANIVTDALKKSRIPVLAGPFFSAKMRYETKNLHPNTTVALNDAGLIYALVTPVVKNLSLEGALAVREGLPYQKALYALTLGAAHILGISEQLGTIESGKKADLVLWDGEPLELKTMVSETIIGGVTVYKRKDALK